MAAKILACISGTNATVGVWRDGKLQDVDRFGDNDKGWQEFENYLRTQPKSTISILADSIDEDYRTETLPHASGRDRSQLVSRKLRQLFRTTPFSAASLQERTAGRRREDRYLFVAMTRPELLSPWLRVVNALEMPIAGIYLLPVVTLSVLERLKINRPNILIVSKNEAGLRQTFCRHGHMRVSRLTPARDDSDRSSVFYAEEIVNTRMYLDALTVTHVDDEVTVLLLDHDGSMAKLPEAITRDRSNLACIHVDPAQMHESLGIPIEEASTYPDYLHLHLLGTARPGMNLVPASLKTRLQIHGLEKYFYAASAAITAVSLIWLLSGWLQVRSTDTEIERLDQEAITYQKRYQAVTEEFPQAPASSQALRDGVEAAKRLQALRQTPQAMMLVVSQALNEMQNINLTRMEWIYGDPEAVAPGTLNAEIIAQQIDSTTQYGIVSAQVVAYNGDQKAALHSINAFSRRLAADPRVAQVEVIRLPLDLDPNAGLNGSTSTRQASESAPFEVALVLRKPNGTAQ